jgi:hypothetical protein
MRASVISASDRMTGSVDSSATATAESAQEGVLVVVDH